MSENKDKGNPFYGALGSLKQPSAYKYVPTVTTGATGNELIVPEPTPSLKTQEKCPDCGKVVNGLCLNAFHIHHPTQEEQLTDAKIIGFINCGYNEHFIDVGDLDEPYRTLLLEAEANAKKAKAYDATIEFLKSEHDLPPDERLIDSPLAMIDKMSELMKEKP